MSKLSDFAARLEANYPNLVDDFDDVLSELRDSYVRQLLAGRHAGAREAFNAMRNLLEMKASEVSAERVDPEWLARMAGA